VREIPEAKKPRSIPISVQGQGQDQGSAVIEDQKAA
jgi:hypothetical protein